MKLKYTILVAALVSGVVLAGAYDSVVSIRNKSSWDIHEMYLSSTDSDDWGPDQLGEHVIGNGETFKLNGIPCDDYDVKLVDEDGDECVVGGVQLCADADSWVISDDDLLECQSATED